MSEVLPPRNVYRQVADHLAASCRTREQLATMGSLADPATLAAAVLALSQLQAHLKAVGALLDEWNVSATPSSRSPRLLQPPPSGPVYRRLH